MSLVILALLPAIVLCVYVYIKDKVEKEPIGLLLLLLFFGILSCFPAMVFETVFEKIFNGFLAFAEGTALYNFLYYFFVVAIVEEGLKWLILVWKTSKSKEFNCTFDGLIYAIFVSLGFAAFENVLYVMENGVAVGVLRAVLSVPGHMFFAVFMGIYYSEWQFKKKMYLIESRLAQKGYIPVPKKNYKADACLSFLIPVTVHAFYNHCCSSLENSIMPLVFIALMVFLYVKGFKTIKKQSKYDEYNLNAINKVIFNKYPQLLEHELEEDLFEVNT